MGVELAGESNRGGVPPVVFDRVRDIAEEPLGLSEGVGWA